MSVPLILILGLSLSLSACNQSGTISYDELEPNLTNPNDLQPVELLEGESLRVVATTTIIGDVVKFIGGKAIELSVLMPFNVDPHAYEPTPSDLQSLSEADIIFINGYGLEISLHSFLEPLTETVPVVSLSQGISVVELQGGGVDLDDHDDEQGVQIDPHVWFDPTNAKHWVNRVSVALSRLIPAQKGMFDEHAETYNTFLDNLDEWITEAIDQIPSEDRIIISDHYLFGYFADRYGFEVAGAVIPVFSSAAEPTAQEIANLEEIISQYDVGAIFVGESFSSSVANRIAEDTGVRLVKLYTGSLSEPDGPAGSYLNFMQYNVTEIVKGLSE